MLVLRDCSCFLCCFLTGHCFSCLSILQLLCLEGVEALVNTYYNLKYALESIEEEFYHLIFKYSYSGYWVSKFHDVLVALKEVSSTKKFLSFLIYCLSLTIRKFNLLTIGLIQKLFYILYWQKLYFHFALTRHYMLCL
ncbi:hypothetical protein J5U23_01826 [Saccharolobus shibatae B12]|uniref:Uncharacterized protein n=1 Tax=Saccharolobus shibatae (strain ATCC 51178 / DSM 5389 / JCM 8931 / NBRC 15437 / B12) TaxID=523848 RepID=A0A8F5BPA7_SACSH|nr:hypothetical protein J5U23_01826 [Saccharolobus shibatae B12]